MRKRAKIAPNSTCSQRRWQYSHRSWCQSKAHMQHPISHK